MTPDEHARMQELEGKVKRYRSSMARRNESLDRLYKADPVLPAVFVNERGAWLSGYQQALMDVRLALATERERERAIRDEAQA